MDSGEIIKVLRASGMGKRSRMGDTAEFAALKRLAAEGELVPVAKVLRAVLLDDSEPVGIIMAACGAEPPLPAGTYVLLGRGDSLDAALPVRMCAETDDGNVALFAAGTCALSAERIKGARLYVYASDASEERLQQARRRAALLTKTWAAAIPVFDQTRFATRYAAAP